MTGQPSELTPQQQELKERSATFVRDIVIACEPDTRKSSHGPSEALRDHLM